MRLSAKLTIGWPDDGSSPLSAPVLHRQASEADDYGSSLGEQLASASGEEILALEQTFRRRPGGARPLSKLVAGLAALPAAGAASGGTAADRSGAGSEPPLVCRIDAFAYGFLKSAKNLDMILPVAKAGLDAFRRTRSEWSQAISAFEGFERTGTPPGTREPISRERYLALRAIVARPSARDELRSLSALLLSGPSTLEELSADLGLNYTLGSRTLAVFEADDVGVVERRAGDVFALRTATLPLVLFCLRETMGLDVLDALPDGSN